MKLNKISLSTIDRLILYRKILRNLINEGQESIYSHRLAHLAENSPSQVRRDFMVIGYNGSPVHGYDIKSLEEGITAYLHSSIIHNVAIIGLGKLGRAILDYCRQRNPLINITACFDIDQQKTGRMINGCHCFHISDLERVIRENRVEVAIITVPFPDQAQEIAEMLVANGVKGLINYTSAQLKLNPSIYIENRDMMLAVEKAVYFANHLDLMKY